MKNKPLLEKTVAAEENRWSINWYGIKIIFISPTPETRGRQYKNPAISIKKIKDYEDDLFFELFIEGEE